MFPRCSDSDLNLISQIVNTALEAVACSNAAYHNLEHTMQVALVGHEMLQGKQYGECDVTSSDWLHFMAALLCHDVGYVRGVCQADQPECDRYTTGVDNEYIQLKMAATDASLRTIHVDRSKCFVAENFTDFPQLDIDRIQHYIELTRFPIPPGPIYQDVLGYSGLARAADLLGQLSDPCYLTKIPALFQEFEETGVHKSMGYYHSNDLRAAYPRFYWNTVSAYVKHGIRYLELTQAGLSILENLQNNLSTVEHELMLAVI